MLSIKTPAKINLFLNITGRRMDGYSELTMLMQTIALFDMLHIRPNAGEQDIRFSSDDPSLHRDPDNNLVVRAYYAFWDAVQLPPIGMKVHLEKNIPMQAGLGGGSSNAAGMLLALNHLACTGLSPIQLETIASRLGSDVPFFVQGGLAIARGRGEQIEHIATPATNTKLDLVVIKPRTVNSDTREAYQLFHQDQACVEVSMDPLLTALGLKETPVHPDRSLLGRAHALNPHMMNDFERVMVHNNPELNYVARTMQALGIHRPMLCGSGSSIFGFMASDFSSRAELEAAFPINDYHVIWTTTHAGSIEQMQMEAV